MTYIENMVDKLVPDDCSWHSEKAVDKWYEDVEKIVNQIIADSRRSFLEAIEPFSRFSSMNHNAYVDAIKQAEVKAEGE